MQLNKLIVIAFLLVTTAAHGMDYASLQSNLSHAIDTKNTPLFLEAVQGIKQGIVVRQKYDDRGWVKRRKDTPLFKEWMVVKLGSSSELDNFQGFDFYDQDGNTPLISAILNDNMAYVHILISNGASYDLPDINHNLSPLYYARAFGNHAMIKIIERAAALDQQDENNNQEN